MRKLLVSLASMLLFFGITAGQAQNKTEVFKVYGKCTMCKSRIEKAAKSVSGEQQAEWKIETKMLSVSFDQSKIDSRMIQKAIAGVGHDTPMFYADNSVYDALPGCCKYERREKPKSGNLKR